MNNLFEVYNSYNKNKVGTFFKILPIAYKACPAMFVSSIFINILHGLSFGVITLCTQMFFEKASDFCSHQVSIKYLIYALLILGSAYIANLIINGVENFIEESYIEYAEGKFSYELNKKINKLSPELFEDPDFLNKYNKAEQGQMGLIHYVQSIIMISTFYPSYYILIGSYLYKLDPGLLVSIILVFAPTIINYFVKIKRYKNLEDNLAPIRRQNVYYQECCVDRNYYKETRQLGVFSFFRRKYVSTLHNINQLKMRVEIKNNVIELILKIMTTVCYCGIVYLLFISLRNGKIGIGDFAAIFTSIQMMFDIMEEAIFRYIGSIPEQLGTMINFIDFMNIEEISGEDFTVDRYKDIQLREVSFRYPKSEHDALNNLNCIIKAGKTTAIVGENGSGKSTLVKILSGLYRPTSGSVFVGDDNMKDVSLGTIYNNLTLVTQKYQKYKMSLKDNITISDHKNSDDQLLLNSVMCDSGIDINDKMYTYGFDTMLSPEFDGIDVSGGQWQRIAIVRALYRKYDYVLLDEPTAAIDPLEESRIYSHFMKIIKGKTGIIVTHRLGSVRLADYIIVMKLGQIVEYGTHEELIKNGKEYNRLYQSQKQWFENNDNRKVENGE